MYRIISIFILILLPAILLGLSGEAKDPGVEKLLFIQEEWSLSEGETLQLELDNTAARSKLIWKSTDESVAAVNESGVVSAKKEGFAEITVQLPDGTASSSTRIHVLKKGLEKINNPLFSELIYSKGITLVRNSVIQCFDIASDGTIFYDQVGGALAHVLFVVRGQANSPYTDCMQLKYFGHGTNMAIEEDGSDTYIWINSNGTKGRDGAYGSNQTFSRIKYMAGGVVEKYAGDTYYLPGKRNIHPAIDEENDLLGVTTSGGGDPFRYFYLYKLSEAKALLEEQVTLENITFGGEEGGGSLEQTERRTLSVKNLDRLEPLNSFRVPRA